jgi:hypothetical protein
MDITVASLPTATRDELLELEKLFMRAIAVNPLEGMTRARNLLNAVRAELRNRR